MAGLFGFFAQFGKKQLGNIGESITQTIVSWDPETATEAEIEEMLAELDKITVEAGKAKAEFDREVREAQAAQSNYDRHMAAADLLNAQMQEASARGDSPQASELQTSLERLLSDLEQLKPEMEREVGEAQEARVFYEEIKDVARVTAEKVKQGRAMLERAKRDMKRAEMQEKMAQVRATRAEKLAGLRKEASELGVALSSMNKSAEEARARAAASDMKAKLLSPERQEGDPNVQAALKVVSGEIPAGSGNPTDRLAALKSARAQTQLRLPS